MRAILIFSVLFFSTFSAFSQIDFEKAYFIDNEGKKIACLIKNVDWRDNPSQFEYKLNDNSGTKIASIENIREFGILDYVKYEKHRVPIDMSSDVTTALKGGRETVYTDKTVFLKKLVEGQISLFLYQNGGVKRFLYKEGEGSVTPLVYKRFVSDGGKIGTNVAFRQQLLAAMTCFDNSDRRLSRVGYKESQLVPLFKAHNLCGGNEVWVHGKPKVKKDFFDISARVGLNHNSFVVGDGSFGQSIGVNGDYGSSFSLRFGIEFEFILPINNGKWSLFFEPLYNKQEISKADEITERTLVYATVEVPVGLRYYFYLNENSRIFLNSSFAFVFNGDSQIETVRKDSGDFLGGVEINGAEEYVSFGVGYDFNRKVSLEFRANTSRDLLGNDVRYNSKYDQSFSLILGYTFL